MRVTLARRVLLYLAASALSAVAAAWMLAERPSPRPGVQTRLPPAVDVSPAPASQSAPTVRVDDVFGVVERSGVRGEWTPVSSRTELGVDESLRTAEGASARLLVGDHASIEVAARSEVAVREITRSVQRFKLARGRVSARYQSDGTRVLRVEGSDGQVVETRGGTLGIVETGEALAVAAMSGNATLTASGHTVHVVAGSQAMAGRRREPEPPEAIPVAVLLRVLDAEPPRPGDRSALVRGTAGVGTRVTVNGQVADMDARGDFRVRIPVHEGENRVVAWVEDALGRSVRRVLPPIVIERSGQVDDVHIQWGASASAR